MADATFRLGRRIRLALQENPMPRSFPRRRALAAAGAVALACIALPAAAQD